MPEPSRIAGVMPTRRSSFAAMSHSHWPKTCVKVVFGGVAGLTMPTAGIELARPVVVDRVGLGELVAVALLA